MRESLQLLCDKFIENRDAVKSAFSMESVYLYPVCAAVFLEKGKMADVEELKACSKLLKDEIGFFSKLSSFRGTGRLAIISMLAVNGQPEEKLEQAMELHEILRLHFAGSQYLPLTAMVLSEMISEGQYDEVAEKAKAVYRQMKKEHPFLTSGEDSVFAALLAVSDKTPEEITAEVEACYELLKPEFFSGNAVQSLAHVLALMEGDPEEKCRRTLDLYDCLKTRKCRYGTGYELGSLGLLAMLPAEMEALVQDIVEVDQFLAEQKGYGVFGPGKKQRLMHAGMIVACEYAHNPAMDAAAVGGAISLIIAEQVALCCAIAASCSVSSSSAD